jgi:2-C-methyl-D-erythritol 4-phosphate cytidylyltransferase
MNEQKKYVIIVAGGKGLRMGSDIPKQFLILEDRPVLMHSIQAFYDYDPAIRIILVLPCEQKAYWENLCIHYDFSLPHQIVSGGETRFHSVKNGLAVIQTTDALIAVHDGVRPLIGNDLIRDVYAQAGCSGGAYPAIPVTDSMRKLTGSIGENIPVDRSEYFLVQTPQAFKSGILFEAYQQACKPEFTDDASVVEFFGTCRPVMVEGIRENIKITTPVDWIIAQAIYKTRRGEPMCSPSSSTHSPPSSTCSPK